MGTHQEIIREQRSVLERKLEQLKGEVSHIYTQLNALTYVERVPPEILQEIFLWVLELCLETGKLYDWFPITHVCRRWRGVALHCWKLWANIEIPCNINYIRAAIERSGNHVISISRPWEKNERKTRSVEFQTVLRAMDRIGAMQVALDSLCRIGLGVRELESVEAPKLVALHDETNYPYGTDRTILSILKAPRLEELRCFWSPFGARAMEIVRRHSSLVSLNLSGPEHRLVIVEPQSFLGALQHLPRLSSLELEFDFEVLLEPDLPIVNLPQLEFLVLRAGLSESRALLDHLTFPAHAHLTTIEPRRNVHVRGAMHRQRLLRNLRGVLSRVYANIKQADEQLCTMELILDEGLTFTITRKPKAGRDVMHSPVNPDRAITELDWFTIRVADALPIEMLPMLLRAVKEEHIPLAELTMIEILVKDTEIWPMRDEWNQEQREWVSEGFRELRCVKVLCLDGWFPFKAIQSIILPLPEAVEIPLPNLHTLRIFNAIKQRCDVPKQHSLAVHPGSCFHNLDHVITRRKAIGAAIVVLEMDFASQLTAQEVQRLRGQVSEGIQTYSRDTSPA